MADDIRVAIGSNLDIVTARQKGRKLAMELGFDGTDVTLIAAAISEVARNIVDHAQQGEVLLNEIHNGQKLGVSIIARDQGPGIGNIPQAMQYGFSTRNGLGVGLPGAKWLMDEFEIVSEVGRGTTVTMKKWRRKHGDNP
jgi:serine/threonine-protein kinase RsbT